MSYRNRNRRRRGIALWLAAALCIAVAAGTTAYAATLAVRLSHRRAVAAYTLPMAPAPGQADRQAQPDAPAQADSQTQPDVQTQADSRAPADRDADDFEYLPVIRRGDDSRKRIAITVDDCFQVGNLRTIVDTARKSGGRLTIFPIGQNLEKPGMAELLRHSVFDLGFEVENHTWSHQRVFRLPEAEMAEEIWRQGQAVNKALGVNYEQHFFRLMGGDGDGDQRTHNYLAQLGFKGIAAWSLSGSDADMDLIRRALKPGAVYLFHTTDGDTAKLKSFIPYAVSQGYELVTLNELVGLAPNAVSAYTTQPTPEPRDYCCDYRTRKLGDYAWCVVGMQDALRRMGYLKLNGAPTGYYGRQTELAISAFQRAAGLPVTGVADGETQRRLLGA